MKYSITKNVMASFPRKGPTKTLPIVREENTCPWDRIGPTKIVCIIFVYRIRKTHTNFKWNAVNMLIENLKTTIRIIKFSMQVLLFFFDRLVHQIHRFQTTCYYLLTYRTTFPLVTCSTKLNLIYADLLIEIPNL